MSYCYKIDVNALKDEKYLFLTDKEVYLITKNINLRSSNPYRICELCKNIHFKLIHTSKTGYYLIKNNLTDLEIDHLEKTIDKKLE